MPPKLQSSAVTSKAVSSVPAAAASTSKAKATVAPSPEATTPSTSKATPSTSKATASTSKATPSTSKATASTSKATPSTSKATASTSRASTSAVGRGRGRASAPASRARGGSRGRGAGGAAAGRRPAARGRGRGRGRQAAGDMGDTFLGKLMKNPSVMGDFMKLFSGLDKALTKRDKKQRSMQLGFGGDDSDESDEEDGDDSSNSDVSDDAISVPEDDIDNFTHGLLASMAAKMGGVSDLRKPGEPRPPSTSDEEDAAESEEEREGNEMAVVSMRQASGSDEESASNAPTGARIKYVPFKDAEFAKAVANAPRISRLSLTELVRTRKERFDFGRSDPKPDKHIEAVLKALGTGTKDVASLVLDDAEWATCNLYSGLLVKLLDRYKQNLRSLSLTSRLLVQPNGGKAKNCIFKVVSSMPHLEELQLTYLPLTLHYYTYRGELQEAADDFPLASLAKRNKQKSTPFPALKRIELHLTSDWFDSQFGSVVAAPGHLDDEDDDDDEEDEDEFEDEFDNVGGGVREEEQEDLLEHLLRYKKDAFSLLDMSSFKKPKRELEILDLFADLTNLRHIALRVEFLHLTAKMTKLEHVDVVFHHSPDPGVKDIAKAAAFVAGRPEPWVGLKSLHLEVTKKSRTPFPFLVRDPAPQPERKVPEHWNQVLTAVASTCGSLTRFALEGCGWDLDAVLQVLSNNPQLEIVELGVCDALEARHLTLLKDMLSLKQLQLSAKLREAAVNEELVRLSEAEWARRSVQLTWVPAALPSRAGAANGTKK